jgi:hypothetical protein
MRLHVLAALAAAALLMAHRAAAFAAPNTPAVLTVAPGGCAAFEYGGLLAAGGGGLHVGVPGGRGVRTAPRKHPFAYEASLLSVDAPDACLGAVK